MKENIKNNTLVTENEKRIYAILRGYCRFCNPSKNNNLYCDHLPSDDIDSEDDDNFSENENIQQNNN